MQDNTNEKKNTNLEEIRQVVIIAAPIQKVWDTVSTAEGIASWFMPNDFQPVIGHEFHIQSPFGPSPCKVLDIDAPNRLSFAWDVDGWIVSFILKELEGQTEFTLIHGGWKTAEEIVTKANESHSVIRDRMGQGWVGIVQKLRTVVEG